MSSTGIPARFSWIEKNNRLFPFVMIFSTWQFHVRFSERVRPKTFAKPTRSSSKEPRPMESKGCLDFEKSITISLHLSPLRTSLFSLDPFSTSSVYWIREWPSLFTTSPKVVSSTNFQHLALDGRRSLIMRRKSQGPSMVPWGTPDGTWLHSNQQSFASFTRWCLFRRKSQTQRTTPRGMLRDNILSTKI